MHGHRTFHLGIVDPHNRKVVRSNTMGWENIDVTELFPQLDGMRLVVENDANAACLASVVGQRHEDDQVVYIIGEGAMARASWWTAAHQGLP